MAMGNSGSTTTTYAFAVIFLLCAMALVAVSFATNHWDDTFVDREALEALGVNLEDFNIPIYYSRSRGLFRTCFPEDASFLDNDPNAVEGRCLIEQGYEIPTRNPATVVYGPVYDIKIHVLRSWFAGLVLAMLFFLVGSITSVLGCWSVSPRLMRSTGTLIFIGMFFAAGAMACYHGVYYLEEQELINVPGTLAYIRSKALIDVDFARLDGKTIAIFGYSYMLGWVTVGASAISGLLFLITGYKFSEKQKDTYEGRKSRKSRRSRAYDHMDKPSYGGDYGYGGPGAFPDPYVDSLARGDPYSGYRY